MQTNTYTRLFTQLARAKSEEARPAIYTRTNNKKKIELAPPFISGASMHAASLASLKVARALGGGKKETKVVKRRGTSGAPIKAENLLHRVRVSRRSSCSVVIMLMRPVCMCIIYGLTRSRGPHGARERERESRKIEALLGPIKGVELQRACI